VFFPFHFGFIGIVFLIFIIFLILRWIFWYKRCGNSARYYSHYSGNDNAQNILKERYAKGEITKEQFEQIKKDLEQK
jgi:putative membrane protein